METSLGQISGALAKDPGPGQSTRVARRLWQHLARDAPMRPVMLATLALGLLAVLLVGGSWMLFARLVATDRAIIASIREDAMWATYQADRHAQTLKWQIDTAVLTGDPTRFAGILAAYDILYSRAILLERGAFSIDLGDEAGISGISIRGATMIVALAGQIDAIDPDASGVIDDLRAIQPVADEIAGQMVDLTLRSNAALSALRVDERADQRHNFIQLGIGVGLIVVVFLCIAVLLALQLRHNLRAIRRMVLLRERSRRQALRAKQASAAKSIFLATMSHEIRTPLNGILGMAETLSLGALRPDQKRQVGVIRTAGGLLLDVINDVLDFSMLESGKAKPNFQPVDLPVIAETLRSVMEPAAERKGLHLTVDMPQERVLTDPGRLRQIAMNLTSNAVKFTDSGSVSVTGTFCAPDRLRVEVRDDGVGIAPENLPLLFRDFSQVDGSFTRRFGGTGLGLAISRRMAEGLGGTIGVESTPGQGSLFWFELPVTLATATPEPEAAMASLTEPGTFRGRILVAEDNAINREVLTGMLQYLGLDHEIALDGQAAVDAVAANNYDIVLMDMQMPHKSGIEATIEIRESGNAVLIAGVTANAFSNNQRDCKRAGMNDFLAKPVSLDSLAALLRRQGIALADKPPCTEARPPDPAPRPPRPAAPAVVSTASADPGPTEADPALDHLRALADVLGAEMVMRLVSQFADDIEPTSAALAAAAATADGPALDRHLHAFKGAAGTLGFAALARQSQDLRDMPAPDAAACMALIDTARRTVGAVQL